MRRRTDKKIDVTEKQVVAQSVQNEPTKTVGYGVPKNRPAKRVPEKSTDLPKEVEQWLGSAQPSKKN